MPYQKSKEFKIAFSTSGRGDRLKVNDRIFIRHYLLKESDNTFVACSEHCAISMLVESSTAI
jgi:hypothetical protein